MTPIFYGDDGCRKARPGTQGSVLEKRRPSYNKSYPCENEVIKGHDKNFTMKPIPMTKTSTTTALQVRQRAGEY